MIDSSLNFNGVFMRFHDINEAMLSAAIQGKYKEVMHWLDQGADINSRTETGSTALMCLVTCPIMPVNVIEMMAKKGAAIDAHDHEGFTALMLSAYQGKTKILQALLNLGADTEKTDHYGRSAQDYAKMQDCKVKKSEMLELLNVFMESKILLNSLYDNFFGDTMVTRCA